MGDPVSVRIVDVVGDQEFRLLPPCADDRFDHRSCDYWEDDVRGSKARRPSWWQSTPVPSGPSRPHPTADPFAPDTLRVETNPFAPEAPAGELANPFAPESTSLRPNPDLFAPESADAEPNPFAPPPPKDLGPGLDAPRKLRLLARGQRAIGSYAKVLLVDGRPAAYTQFGPLSAYPRAQRIRELYPRLPSAPLPAVITCIATTADSRGRGLARLLVQAVCDDLASRGFAAVETYPDLTLGPNEASAARPGFWEGCGFDAVVADERYPVMRLELG